MKKEDKNWGANNKELAYTWRKIKSDRLNHVNLLKDALEKEIHAG